MRLARRRQPRAVAADFFRRDAAGCRLARHASNGAPRVL